MWVSKVHNGGGPRYGQRTAIATGVDAFSLPCRVFSVLRSLRDELEGSVAVLLSSRRIIERVQAAGVVCVGAGC